MNEPADQSEPRRPLMSPGFWLHHAALAGSRCSAGGLVIWQTDPADGRAKRLQVTLGVT